MRLIAIDGRSGSGKTAYAAGQFPGATALHMDDLYAGWSGLRDAPTSLTEQVLAPLRRGEHAAYRRFDWHTGTFAESVTVEPADLIVVEGVGSSAAPATDFYDERIWLTAPAPVRKARALARDGDTFAPHWDEWAAQEDVLFPADPPQWADTVIDTGPAPALIAALSATLHDADPMGLAGAPRDEYDAEATILADQIPGSVDAADTVRRCFDQMFWAGAVRDERVITSVAAELVATINRQ
ncbi:hypothetical protein [Branchiibius sp. NY16-3462-2]|uniref:hypothetical protein n=1 Tax=Branchiibius sp. NY16-3462-2 TaxID=1807500 RepID=UPI000B2FB8C3|nr:hypothetical protein [Branchiibius sp. NY16-3462-2]